MTSVLAIPSATAVSFPPTASRFRPEPILHSVHSLVPDSTFVTFESDIHAPFAAIRRLFDHLHADANDAGTLNAVYPKRGIFKTAAMYNGCSDQKFTIDLSPSRTALIPAALHKSLSIHGLDEVVAFFNTVNNTYSPAILSQLSMLAGADLAGTHMNNNVNFRLCDYNPDTASPACDNGCGAHTDYGTFTIIFQDGTPGLELEDANKPGTWIAIPGHATVILAGWCAIILSGGSIRAPRHRVRRTPGVRRLSAILFVAPDLDSTLKPLEGVQVARPFSKTVMMGEISAESFKETMGKKWRHREGNEDLDIESEESTQDMEIEKLIWQADE